MRQDFASNTIHIEYSERTSANMKQHHIHNLYELYYLEQGKGTYFIDDRSYEIQAGDVFIIPRGILHKTSYQNLERVRTAIYFSASYASLPVLQRFGTTVHLYRNEEIAEEIRFYMKQIRENDREKPPFYEEQLRLNFQALLLLLLQKGREPEQKESGETLGMKMIQYVQEHYTEHLSLQELSLRFSLSGSHLSHVFKKESGFGFNEYLTLVRLQNARKMIMENPEKAISEVAFACGYSDSNYFSLCFKKVFGMVPHALKK